MIYNSVFLKCLYYFTLQICVFMTCSTSYSHYDTLLDPWNVSMYACMYGPLKTNGEGNCSQKRSSAQSSS